MSISDGDSELGIEALQLGAVDLVHKPTALATDRLYELADELIAKVPSPPSARQRRARGQPPARRGRCRAARRTRVELVVIGTSTGGPQALTRLLDGAARATSLRRRHRAAHPRRLHRGARATAERRCRVAVVEASDGARCVPGTASSRAAACTCASRATAGLLAAHLDQAPRRRAAPARRWTCSSRAPRRRSGRPVLGVVLTGMGDDGLEGARAIHAARRPGPDRGGVLVRRLRHAAARRRGRLSNGEVPLEEMADKIVESL